MDKLKQLQDKIAEIQTKSLVANDMRAFVKLVLEVAHKNKEELAKLSNEQINIIKEAISYIEIENEKFAKQVETLNDTRISKLEKEVANTLKEAVKALTEIKLIDVKDGIDGKDGKDGLDGLDGKDGSPDTRKEIVKKINSGKKNDPKIEAKQIEGVEKLATNENLDRAISILDQRTQFLINKKSSSVGAFTDLTDTPNSYSGQAGKYVKINATADGLEFDTVSGGTWGSITGTITDQTDLTTYLSTTYQPAGAYLESGDNVSELTNDAGYIDTETDPVFSTWLSTTPPLFSETDPVFSAWLITTPPLYSESDPIFTQWLSDNDPLFSGDDISKLNNDVGYITTYVETDPVFSSWLSTTPPLYSETDPVWTSEKASYSTTAQADLLYYPLDTNPANYLTSFTEQDPVFTAWLSDTPPLYSETDPVFSAWLLATPPLYSFTETDPVFTSWLSTTPPLFSGDDISKLNNDTGFITLGDIPTETDPVFSQWLIDTPPLFSETDPAFSNWLSSTNLISLGYFADDTALIAAHSTAVDGNYAIVGSTNTIWIWDTTTSAWVDTITQPLDEKVKYDAADPSAGYVADKFVAGTGISVAEGTGVNENKLVITNSSPMAYPGVGIALSGGSSWGTSIADNSSNWNTAYSWGNWSGANTGITSLLNNSLYVGRDADNNISWATDDHLKITIAGTLTDITSISTGTSNNNKLVTQGYVDDILTASTPPGGSNTYVQYNDSGSFGGDSDFTWDKSTKKLSINGVFSAYSNGDKFAFYEDDVATTDAFLKATNATSLPGVFGPIMWAKSNNAGYPGLWMLGDSTNGDTGNIPVFLMQARYNNGLVSGRPLFAIQNRANEALGGRTYFQIGADGKIGLGTATTTYQAYIYNRNASANEKLLVVGSNLNTECFTVDEDGDVAADGNILLTYTDSQKFILGAGTDMAIYYDGTNGNIDTDLVGASDLVIDCGTDKTLVLEETVWNDIQFNVESGRVGSANFPDWDDTFTANTGAYKFDVDDYIDLGTQEMLHNWKEGTDIYFHVHTALDGANASGSSQYAKFIIYIAYADEGGVFTETNKNIEIEIPTGTSDLTHLFGTATALAMTGLTIGTQMNIRLKRIAATTGTEYPNHIFITQVGIHYEIDTLGSRQIGTK